MVAVVNHEDQPLAVWRPGNKTQLMIGAQTGATRLAVAEQWFEPGTGAPTHTHGDIEETITVLAGTGEFWVDDERAVVTANQTILLPPYSWHGFTNTGDDILHVRGVWSAASVPTEYAEEPEKAYEIAGIEGKRVDAARTVRS